MNEPKPGTRQHRNRQFWDHRKVQGDAVTGLEPGKIVQHRCYFVDLCPELLIGDRPVSFILRFWYKDQCCFVSILGQVAVDAVVGSIELPSNKPFPEGSVAGVQGGVPVPIPRKQVGIFFETLGELIEAESLVDRRINQVGLTNEFRRGIVIFFLLPVDGDLSLADVVAGIFCYSGFIPLDCRLCFFCHNGGTRKPQLREIGRRGQVLGLRRSRDATRDESSRSPTTLWLRRGQADAITQACPTGVPKLCAGGFLAAEPR
jgi:hypothetical protein